LGSSAGFGGASLWKSWSKLGDELIDCGKATSTAFTTEEENTEDL
jgi:hypothetical protein